MTRKRFVLFRSFRVKITLVLILVLSLSGAVSSFLISEYALKAQLNQLRNKLMVIAQAMSLAIDAEALSGIPLNKDGIDSQQYKAIEKKLLHIKEVAPSLAYVYILKKTEKPGILKFVIDIPPGAYQEHEPPACPGDVFDYSGFTELMKAFDGPAADEAMVADKWGVFLSGYAPIHDSRGNVIAILGIDMSADDVYSAQRKVRKIIILFFVIGLIISIFLGILISARVTSPVKKLAEGTRHISSGDLQYRVNIKGQDEISELADAFNKMAAALFKARRKLVGYFYRVVQSLIRVMEARDPYTKGHSDRVAGYSVKIATRLGLPAEKIELLKEAALLHDIGKLGIQEVVLNKTTVLSDADKEMIRKHPAIGEEILKPVSPDREMLAIVRGHHERYDGTGYPDRLSGDKIDILAAIVSVADSYDAMTSHRAYMTNLTKDEAIAQLKSGKGLQFNPGVVDAFIDVLKNPS